MPEGLHGGVGVQALGDGVGDDGLAFFFQQFNQPLLLPHQRVDLRRLPVKKVCDDGLLVEWRNGKHAKSHVQQKLFVHVVAGLARCVE